MKLIKILALIIVLFGTYALFNAPDKDTKTKNQELQEWKKNAKTALKSAMGWQALVNKVDKQDITDAPIIVNQLLANIPDVKRITTDAPLPILSKNYVSAKPYVDDFYSSANTLKSRVIYMLEFALDHNDIIMAEKAFESIKENRKDLIHVSAAKLGFFYASNSNCAKAKEYLNLLAPLKNEKSFFINHTKRPISGTFTFAKKTIRIWSQTAMICSSLEEALNIIAKHYPLRITNDQFLLETYVDYAIALKLADYDQDAARFIAIAENLLATGTFENVHNAKPYILYYSMLFENPEIAYDSYIKFIKKYRKSNPNSPLINTPFLQILANKFTLKGKYSEALEAIESTKYANNTGLNLIIEHAHNSLNRNEQVAFFKNLAAQLQTKAPFNNHYLYEPLLKIALYLKKNDENQEAEIIITAAYDYLENGEQIQKDKYFKKRSIDIFAKYLVFMGEAEKGKELLDNHPDIKNTYKAWGALYGYYLNKNKKESAAALKEKLSSFGAYTINSAIDYLIYKDNWKGAEKLANDLNEDHKVGQYKTFAYRRMGLSMSNTLHTNNIKSFQFNEPSIINQKLCRLYNHCK